MRLSEQLKLEEDAELVHLTEELKDVTRTEWQNFLDQVDRDDELKELINTPIKDLPRHQFLAEVGSFWQFMTLKGIMLKTLQSADRGYHSYFVYNNDRFEGYVQYYKKDGSNRAGDIMLFKFQDDATTMQDVLDLSTRLVNENFLVQFACFKSNIRVIRSYEIFLKRQERRGMITKQYEEDSEIVFEVYNEEAR